MAKHDLTKIPFSKKNWRIFLKLWWQTSNWNCGRYWKFCFDICRRFWTIEKIRHGGRYSPPPPAGRELRIFCRDFRAQSLRFVIGKSWWDVHCYSMLLNTCKIIGKLWISSTQAPCPFSFFFFPKKDHFPTHIGLYRKSKTRENI